MRAAATVVFLTLACSAFAGGYSYVGKMGNTHYEFKASEADITRTPIWKQDSAFPPLSAREAQQIAKREFDKLVGKTPHPWAVRETPLLMSEMGILST